MFIISVQAAILNRNNCLEERLLTSYDYSFSGSHLRHSDK